MSYTPEITEVTIVDSIGNDVAVIKWADEATLNINTKDILTNSEDWPDLSAAIQAAIVKMEQSTAKVLNEKANANIQA